MSLNFLQTSVKKKAFSLQIEILKLMQLQKFSDNLSLKGCIRPCKLEQKDLQ